MNSGIDFTLCKLIADNEISITVIRERITKRFEYQNNLFLPNSYCNGQVLDLQRLESDLLANDNIGLDNLSCNELELEPCVLELNIQKDLDLDSFRLESDIFNDPNYEPYRLEPDV